MIRIKPRHVSEAARSQGRVIVVALLICMVWISFSAAMG